MKTIDEAIKGLQILKGEVGLKGRINEMEIIQLGTEALREVKDMRATFLLIDFGLLPGETEDKK